MKLIDIGENEPPLQVIEVDNDKPGDIIHAARLLLWFLLWNKQLPSRIHCHGWDNALMRG